MTPFPSRNYVLDQLKVEKDTNTKLLIEFLMPIRQPIVSVLGHVDHGKTLLLDHIRGTTVASREAGLITQHIGATEIPIDHILGICSSLMKDKKFNVPGLLFIDTPGHHSFTTLRARGGSLADLAVLVVDVTEGIKPQTLESISILKRFKTPFIIAFNKLDLLHGWRSAPEKPFVISVREQNESVVDELNDRLYELIGNLYDEGISANRYDKIDNFTKNVAIVPLSAKTGEGIPDLLMMLVGLAQRFLQEDLTTEEGPARGTILEIKEERGLGPTLDVIIYSGTLTKGDTVVLGTKKYPIVTRVKAILKPKPLDEIRDPSDRFESLKSVSAAAGIKVACQDVEGALAGGPLMVVDEDRDEILKEIAQETEVEINVQDEGVMIKADAIGSLEALAFEAEDAGIPIRKYEIGDISRRDIMEVSAYRDKLHRTILGFNVGILPDAKEVLHGSDVEVFQNDVVYRLMEDYEEWVEEQRIKDVEGKRDEFAFPGKIKVLPGCVFRVSKPAIVGVRVLSGRIRTGQVLINRENREIGRIRSIRSGEESLQEAKQGEEIAIALDGVTVGRQIDVEDILYVDIRGSKVKEIEEADLTEDENMALEEVKNIKREEEPFWGM